MIIGIDTGVTTGYASWDTKNQRFYTVESMKIHEAMDKIRRRQRLIGQGVFGIQLVRVEDARLVTLPRRFQKHTSPAQLQGVGSVKRDAKIWEDFLTDLGIPFMMVNPKSNRTKMNAKDFKRTTGWAGRTNEHARDAGMLVYGFSTAQAERIVTEGNRLMKELK